jgi:hypothetical protein
MALLTSSPRDAPPLVLPHFVIVGAMRSGTTALATYLKAHPQVFMSPRKEVHFFDDHFHEGMQWYSRFFAGAQAGSKIGEATPNYMYDGQAISRMASVLPEAQLVVILRNPVDRAYSHYWQKVSYGTEHLDFRSAVAREPARLAPGDPTVVRTYSYIDRGRYLGQLKRIRAHYPQEALHLILFEEMKANPVHVLERLCRFIGVDPALVPSGAGRRINAYTTFRSPGLRRFSKTYLPKSLQRLVGKLNTRTGSYPPMSREVRSELLELFKADNAALSSWLGRDLDLWRS